MPVIQTRRRSVMPESSSAGEPADCVASASAPNVASVREAIGRVKNRSTNAAHAGGAGKSCSIVTRQPGPRCSIRHVTSMPAVAPPRCTKRSRHAAGSAQVRARHATGSPYTPSGPIGRTATNWTTTAPSASVAQSPRSPVVGQQRRPPFDVVGEREDGGRGRRDVDRDGRLHRRGPLRPARPRQLDDRGSRSQDRREIARVHGPAGRHEIAHEQTHALREARAGSRAAAPHSRTATASRGTAGPATR